MDESGFEAEMESQRERGRGSWKGNQEESPAIEELLARGVTSTFVGYGETETDSKILAILADGVLVDSAKAGQVIEIVLDKTPFYGESGGRLEMWVPWLAREKAKFVSTIPYCVVED